MVGLLEPLFPISPGITPEPKSLFKENLTGEGGTRGILPICWGTNNILIVHESGPNPHQSRLCESDYIAWIGSKEAIENSLGILSFFLPGHERRSPTTSLPIHSSNHPQPLFPSEAWHWGKIQSVLALTIVVCCPLSISLSVTEEAIPGLKDLLFQRGQDAGAPDTMWDWATNI